MEWKNSSSAAMTEVCSILNLDCVFSTVFPDESYMDRHYCHLCKTGVIGFFCLTVAFAALAFTPDLLSSYLMGDTRNTIALVKLDS